MSRLSLFASFVKAVEALKLVAHIEQKEQTSMHVFAILLTRARAFIRCGNHAAGLLLCGRLLECTGGVGSGEWYSVQVEAYALMAQAYFDMGEPSLCLKMVSLQDYFQQLPHDNNCRCIMFCHGVCRIVLWN